MRLDCMTRFGGCKSPCEVMPSAWVDAKKEADSKGQPFPPPMFDIGCTFPPNFHPHAAL